MRELIKDIKKELKGCSFGMKALMILVVMIMLVGAILIDYLVCALIVYAICWCFSLEFIFTFKLALGIYLVYLLLKGCVGR